MFLGVLDVYLRPPIDWYRCLGLNPSSQKVGLTPLPVYYRIDGRGRAANNCTTCFSGFKQKIEVISITVTFASQSSADLSSGRRPMSKSAEFCDANVIVVEQ